MGAFGSLVVSIILEEGDTLVEFVIFLLEAKVSEGVVALPKLENLVLEVDFKIVLYEVETTSNKILVVSDDSELSEGLNIVLLVGKTPVELE